VRIDEPFCAPAPQRLGDEERFAERAHVEGLDHRLGQRTRGELARELTRLGGVERRQRERLAAGLARELGEELAAAGASDSRRPRVRARMTGASVARKGGAVVASERLRGA